MDFAWVAMGAVFGALARKTLSDVSTVGPWHIAAINIGGSAALGALSAQPVPKAAKLALGVGFCGAFTTFSTFSVDVVAMLEAGHVGKAAGYVALNNVGSIGGAFAAYKLVKLRPR